MKSWKQSVDNIFKVVFNFSLSFTARWSYSVLEGVQEKIDFINIDKFLTCIAFCTRFQFSKNLSIFWIMDCFCWSFEFDKNWIFDFFDLFLSWANFCFKFADFFLQFFDIYFSFFSIFGSRFFAPFFLTACYFRSSSAWMHFGVEIKRVG